MQQTQQKQLKEEEAIVLDFLPHGYAYEKANIKTSIAQALGIAHLSILELIPKKDVYLQPQQKVYIGDGKREEIHHIKGKIEISKLTSTAKAELKHAIEKMVEDNQSRFVEFFNKAQPLSMRMHQLELLPGLGKKHMWEIIEKRKEKPFVDFKDLQERVKLLPNPKQVIVKRILSELEGKEKYSLFAK
jgi:putative nucleotide binding protein